MSFIGGYQSDVNLNGINYVGDFPIDHSVGGFGITTGINNYLLELSPAISQYRQGMLLEVRFTEPNTGAVTINVNNRGAKAIKKNAVLGLIDLTVSDIIAGKIYLLLYDGTNFQVANASSVPSDATEAQKGIAQIATMLEIAAGENNTKIVTPAKLAAYIADKITGLWEDKGVLNCAVNPNYPAGQVGDAYTVSVAGKIGGAQGQNVGVRDIVYCRTNNPGGTEENVGSFWTIIQANLESSTELIAGYIRIATQFETNEGLSNVTGVTPLKLKTLLDSRIATEDIRGIAEIATQSEADVGIDNTRIITPLKLQVRLNNYINREFLFELPGAYVNPNFNFTPGRNQIALINGNLVVVRDFRFKPNNPLAPVSAHVLNFPKPVNGGPEFGGTLFANSGNRFTYSIDSNGRVFLFGTFYDSNDELLFNINPYVAKFPIELYPTQPPS